MLQRQFFRTVTRRFCAAAASAQPNMAPPVEEKDPDIPEAVPTNIKIFGSSGSYAHNILNLAVEQSADVKVLSQKLNAWVDFVDESPMLKQFMDDTELNVEDKLLRLENDADELPPVEEEVAALPEGVPVVSAPVDPDDTNVADLPAGSIFELAGIGGEQIEDEIVRGLIEVTMENDEGHLLEEIAEDFSRLMLDHTNSVTCVVTSATDLTEDQQRKIHAKLSAATKKGQNLSVSYAVDPNILGGLKLDFGDKTQDLTARTAIMQGEQYLRSA